MSYYKRQTSLRVQLPRRTGWIGDFFVLQAMAIWELLFGGGVSEGVFQRYVSEVVSGARFRISKLKKSPISTCGEHRKGIFDCQRICRQRSTLLRFSVLAIMFVEFVISPASPTVEFAEVLFPQ